MQFYLYLSQPKGANYQRIDTSTRLYIKHSIPFCDIFLYKHPQAYPLPFPKILVSKSHDIARK